VAAWTLPALIALHVAGVITSSVLEKQNLTLGMVTGFKQVPDADAVPAAPTAMARGAGWVLATLVGAAAVLGLWKLMPIGEAQGATPLLSKYEANARSEDPTFKAFDAERGRLFYAAEHATKSGALACASCHTSDPTKPGRTPVGKNIEPLAPSANPARFTDQAKADKWFDRNCKQVLDRVCTARERGDLLAWLLTR
jgi:cytochrome c553